MAENKRIIRLLMITESLPQAEMWSNSVRERSYVVHTIRDRGYAVRTLLEDTLAGVTSAIERQRWDVIVMSADLSALTIQKVLDAVVAVGKEIPCIAVTEDLATQEQLYNMPLQGVLLAHDIAGVGLAVMREFVGLVGQHYIRRLKQTLAEAEQREQLLLVGSEQAIAYIQDGMHLFANNAYLAMFGYDNLDVLLNTPFLDLISLSEQGVIKAQLRHVIDSEGTEQTTSSASYRHVSGEEAVHEFKLQQSVFEDEVCVQLSFKLSLAAAPKKIEIDKKINTGLLLRNDILAQLTSLVRNAQSGDNDSAVAYFSLENTAAIKADIGLGEIDNLMAQIAEHLLPELTEDERMGRFAEGVFLMTTTAVHDAEIDAHLNILQQHIVGFSPMINNQPVVLQCSVSVTRIGEQSESVSAVLSQLDLAWESAVASGGNQLFRHRIVPSKREEQAASKARLTDLIVADELDVFYQPITALQGEAKKMYDVSVHCDAIGDLVVVAAEANMATELDKWLITNVLSKLTTVPVDVIFFITLSENTLIETKHITWLHATLKKYPRARKQIVFEISDNIAVKQAGSIRPFMKLLSKQGYQFALSDFGTGMGFSQSLEAFDVNYLKINGAFVESMASDADNQEAVAATAKLIKKAGKISIAEQVSDAQSMALLWGMNVAYAMGDYIQPPMLTPDYGFGEDEA